MNVEKALCETMKNLDNVYNPLEVCCTQIAVEMANAETKHFLEYLHIVSVSGTEDLFQVPLAYLIYAGKSSTNLALILQALHFSVDEYKSFILSYEALIATIVI